MSRVITAANIQPATRGKFALNSGDGDGKADADIIIGGSSAKFDPEIISQKWDGEAFLSIASLVPMRATPEFDAQTERLELISQDGNRKDAWLRNLDGSLEYEIILGTKPPQPELLFNLDFSPGLEFIFQPPLTQIEIDRGNIRPANVVGSYAVYHSKKNNKYKTGKFAHLYQWTMTDADGKQAFGAIDIDPVGKKLRFSDPLNFLETATYPVTIGPTLGYTTLGASEDDTGNYIINNRVLSGVAGDANPGTFFYGGRISTGSGTVMAAFYADTGSTTPDGAAKVSGNAQLTVNSATKQFFSAAMTWTGITASTNYHMSINGVANVKTAADTGETCRYALRNHSNDMPDPWGPANEGFVDVKMSCYLDYTASGGVTTRQYRLLTMGVS